MTPSQQMNNNIRNLIASAKAPVVDKLQECLEENRKLKDSIERVWGKLTQRNPSIGGHVAGAVERTIATLEARLEAKEQVIIELANALSLDAASKSDYVRILCEELSAETKQMFVDCLEEQSCTCPPGIREGVLGGPICHACERQLEELYGDEIPF